MALQALQPHDPATLGPYALRGRLGFGGMGVVYLGFAVSGEPVAVKTLPTGVGADVRARLRREADLLAQVQHPRVARFTAADLDADRPWLAMEYVAGPSLTEATKPLSTAALRQLTDGLAEALAALHQVGLVHRDVKPSNIILTFDGPVLVDLGIAVSQDVTSLTADGLTVGTPAWMAPEQLAGGTVGPATDVWGWGAVANYAATGQAPFGDGPVPALAHRIQHTDPDLSRLPGWLRDPVARALSKDPSVRPSAQALLGGPAGPTVITPSVNAPTTAIANTLGETVADHGSNTSETQLATRLDNRTPRRQRRVLLIGTAALAVIAIAVGLLLALHGNNTPSAEGSSPPAETTNSASGTTAGTGSRTSPSSAPTNTASAASITPAQLIADKVCKAPCTITGKVRYQDPIDGPSTLVTVLNAKNNSEPGAAYIAAISDTGQTIWTYRLPGNTWYLLQPAPKPIDNTGHIFLNYNPGRYNGVIVLDPTGDGFDDFQSLPTKQGNGRFYSATATDPTHSGSFQIDASLNDCVPDCADGKDIHVVYKWTGTAYQATN